MDGLAIPVPPRTAAHPGPDAPRVGTKDRRYGDVVVAIGPLVATNRKWHAGLEVGLGPRSIAGAHDPFTLYGAQRSSWRASAGVGRR